MSRENYTDQPIKVQAKTAEALLLAYPLQVALNRWWRDHFKDWFMVHAVLNRCDDPACPCQSYDVQQP